MLVIFTGVLTLLVAILALIGKLNSLVYHPVDMNNYWVSIPAGEFIMGSKTGSNDERPVTKVVLDNFEIGKYEVTNRQYAQCVQAGICDKPGSSEYSNEEYARHPVTDVSWYDAKNFCKYVNGRLPTEAEWEYAARGGLEEKDYPWGDAEPNCELVNFYAGYECMGGTSPVGNYPANNYGLHDMAGNVWEWTADLYLDYPYNPEDTGVAFIDVKTLRGGSMINDEFNMRVSVREFNVPDIRIPYIGFRCSR